MGKKSNQNVQENTYYVIKYTYYAKIKQDVLVCWKINVLAVKGNGFSPCCITLCDLEQSYNVSLTALIYKMESW